MYDPAGILFLQAYRLVSGSTGFPFARLSMEEADAKLAETMRKIGTRKSFRCSSGTEDQADFLYPVMEAGH